MICTKTLILHPTNIEAITEGVDYKVTKSDETGDYITNNQGEDHHFSQAHKKEYF
jgi:hypothetical protein